MNVSDDGQIAAPTHVVVRNYQKGDYYRGIYVEGLTYHQEYCPLLWAQIRRTLRETWRVDYLGLFFCEESSCQSSFLIILHANMACADGFGYQSEDEYWQWALDLFERGSVAGLCQEIFCEVAGYLTEGLAWPDAINKTFPDRPARKQREAEEAAAQAAKRLKDREAYWPRQKGTQALANG